MTTNIELEKYAKKDFKIPLKGIYRKDELPKSKKGLFIVNLQDSNVGNGTHWVCFDKNEKFSFYFDSFGIKPPVEIIDFCQSPILYSEKKIQHDSSANCGFYCLYFLYCFHNDYDYNRILNKFKEDSIDNDKILQEEINKIL